MSEHIPSAPGWEGSSLVLQRRRRLLPKIALGAAMVLAVELALVTQGGHAVALTQQTAKALRGEAGARGAPRGGGHSVGEGRGQAVGQAGRGAVRAYRDVHDLGQQGRFAHHGAVVGTGPFRAGRFLDRCRRRTAGDRRRRRGQGPPERTEPRGPGRQAAALAGRGRPGPRPRPGDPRRGRRAHHPPVAGRPARPRTGRHPRHLPRGPARRGRDRRGDPYRLRAVRRDQEAAHRGLHLHAAAEGRGA